MQVLARPWGAMHIRVDGPSDGPTVVFANSLGTDLHLWDAVLPRLQGVRVVRFDKPGHGLSDLPRDPASVSIAALADDAAALIEAVCSGPVVFVGLSIGGMIGQQLAASRPDLVRGLVVANSAVQMGTADSWNTRIAAVEADGIESIADAVMERWFAPAFRATPELSIWRNMLVRTPRAGYVAACHALAAADLTARAGAIAVPTAVIAGQLDGAAPPDIVAATAALIDGATYTVMPGVGHIPPVEAPAAFADILNAFLAEVRP
nr:3-oxoadipate enol-lactonase [Ketogulonicigenium robustum]